MDIIAGRFPGGRPLRRCREVVLNVARGGFEGGPPSTPRLTNEAGKAQAGFAVRVRGLEFGGALLLYGVSEKEKKKQPKGGADDEGEDKM